MRNDDDLDRMLDDALRGYCDVEPRAGIEGRILHRVRTAGGRRWWWLVIVPVLAGLIMAILFQSRTPARVRHTATAPLLARSSAKAGPAIRVVTSHEQRARASRRAGNPPRKSEFPTPSPLTREEQAMVLLASRFPFEAQSVNEDRQLQPISIPELKITPLQSDGE